MSCNVKALWVVGRLEQCSKSTDPFTITIYSQCKLTVGCVMLVVTNVAWMLDEQLQTPSELTSTHQQILYSLRTRPHQRWLEWHQVSEFTQFPWTHWQLLKHRQSLLTAPLKRSAALCTINAPVQHRGNGGSNCYFPRRGLVEMPFKRMMTHAS